MCVALGDPPPTVTWVEPDATPAPDEQLLMEYATLSSIPAQDLNVTYTCQISAPGGVQNLSIVPYTSGLLTPNSQTISTWIWIVLVVFSVFTAAVATSLAIFFWLKGEF